MFTMIPYRRYLSSPAKVLDSMLSDSFFRPMMNEMAHVATWFCKWISGRKMTDAHILRQNCPGPDGRLD